MRFSDDCDGANEDEEGRDDGVGRPKVDLNQSRNTLRGLEVLQVSPVDPISVDLRAKEEHEVQDDLQGEYDSHRAKGDSIIRPEVFIVVTIAD